jgi:hypothetical protein
MTALPFAPCWNLRRSGIQEPGGWSRGASPAHHSSLGRPATSRDHERLPARRESPRRVRRNPFVRQSRDRGRDVASGMQPARLRNQPPRSASLSRIRLLQLALIVIIAVVTAGLSGCGARLAAAGGGSSATPAPVASGAGSVSTSPVPGAGSGTGGTATAAAAQMVSVPVRHPHHCSPAYCRRQVRPRDADRGGQQNDRRDNGRPVGQRRKWRPRIGLRHVPELLGRRCAGPARAEAIQAAGQPALPFRAVRPGRSALSSFTDAACLHAAPACEIRSRCGR